MIAVRLVGAGLALVQVNAVSREDLGSLAPIVKTVVLGLAVRSVSEIKSFFSQHSRVSRLRWVIQIGQDK